MKQGRKNKTINLLRYSGRGLESNSRQPGCSCAGAKTTQEEKSQFQRAFSLVSQHSINTQDTQSTASKNTLYRAAAANASSFAWSLFRSVSFFDRMSCDLAVSSTAWMGISIWRRVRSVGNEQLIRNTRGQVGNEKIVSRTAHI